MGILGDKNIDYIGKRIKNISSIVLIATPPSPRALPAKELARRISSFKRVNYFNDSLEKVLNQLNRLKLGNVLICGSLYLVGECRKLLLKQIPEILWEK